MPRRSAVALDYLALIASQGLTLGEARILTSVGLGIDSLEILPKLTSIRDWNSGPFGDVPEEEARSGLASCLSKGWLRLVDEHVLAEVRSLLEEQGVTDFEGCLPLLGNVDFTPEGARLYRRLDVEWNGPDWRLDSSYQASIPGGERHYSRTLQGVLNVIDYYKDYYAYDPPVVSISEPTPTGPWCVGWWEIYPTGFFVDVLFGPKNSQPGPST